MIVPAQLLYTRTAMEWMSTWASREAREQGHHWFGGEHLLLAISREPSIAHDVLGELGVTQERL